MNRTKAVPCSNTLTARTGIPVLRDRRVQKTAYESAESILQVWLLTKSYAVSIHHGLFYLKLF